MIPYFYKKSQFLKLDFYSILHLINFGFSKLSNHYLKGEKCLT